MESKEEHIENYKSFLRFQGIDNEKIIDTMCLAFERGYDLANNKSKQLVDEIAELKVSNSKLNYIIAEAENVYQNKCKEFESLIDKLQSDLKDAESVNEGLKNIKQPNEIEVGNLVIDRLNKDEYFLNPRNRATRIITEIMLREFYLQGFNSLLNKLTQSNQTK